ncbi:GGDEF domain-containing protein [Halomonas sp. JS92-SW72]|uniref:GGDEF domain-containing protein n=1 Tax=Halomonas sp. JS92-SW72 TaxID=2306583 RepID=UPI000E5BF091|nr:GGDEF domain-containing protein [Halomonas sp. JS92-SW72]AXY41154.1 GGDEF domain-containing protein [Halomonas sp. JS92-SW72]
MHPVSGLTARTAVLSAVMVGVTLASIVLALNTFAKYREAVGYLADRQAQVLVTTSRLLQQSEGMVASTAMLLLADDHLARRQAMFEIADRKEWIGRLVEDLAEFRKAPEQFDAIYDARDRLVANLETLDALVEERIDLRLQLERQALPDVPTLAQLARVESGIAEVIRAARTLTTELSVAVGFHLAAAREEAQQRVRSLADETQRSAWLLKASGLAALLAVLATVLFIQRSVVGRLSRLELALRCERPRPEEIDVQGRDEIARVARTVHRYVDRINLNEQRILTINRELDFLASHDALTRLHNRRYFEQALAEGAESLLAGDYCAAMIDIDHFKQVNDLHGHAVGDRVIVQVAGLIRDGLPDGALLARYGGEEFAALLPGVDMESARECLERIRQRVADTPTAVEGGDVAVTVSIGLAPRLPMGGFEHSLKAADESLYLAKRRGRNRLVLRPQRATDPGVETP